MYPCTRLQKPAVRDGIEEGEKMPPREMKKEEKEILRGEGGYIKKTDQANNRVLITQRSN